MLSAKNLTSLGLKMPQGFLELIDVLNFVDQDIIFPAGGFVVFNVLNEMAIILDVVEFLKLFIEVNDWGRGMPS